MQMRVFICLICMVIYLTLIGKTIILEVHSMKGDYMKNDIRLRLITNHLSNAWLTNQLRKYNLNFDNVTISKMIRGERNGDKVIAKANEILDSYETWNTK